MNKKAFALSLAFMAAFAIALVAQEGGLAIGSIVAAKWSNGAWYRGKITAIDNDKYSVTYDDNDRATLSRADLKPIPLTPKVAVGQKVFALWTDKKFYMATVSEVRKDGIVVAWDDGSGSMAVAFGKFALEGESTAALQAAPAETEAVTTKTTAAVKAAAAAKAPPSEKVAPEASAVPAAAAASAAPTVILKYDGNVVGRVEPNGEVWLQGNRVGEIRADGQVWKNGNRVGEIRANGKIWKDGNLAGEIRVNGEVWKNGNRVGEVRANGQIWANGNLVGNALGLKPEWAAAVYFFFFVGN